MSPENSQRLFERFPKLYQLEYLEWGFQIRDGWFDLMWELSLELEKHDVIVYCVKQKFASLRLSFYPPAGEMSSVIDAFEGRSLSTCEECGHTPSEIRNLNGYYVTLCDTCHQLQLSRK